MSTTASQFDFGSALGGDEPVEAYHPPEREVLPKGNYALKVTESEMQTTKTAAAYPMWYLRLENDTGVQYDRLVISPAEFSVAKVLGFIEAVGLPKPQPGQDFDPSNGRFTDDYVARALGKDVGVIVREEPDNRPDHHGEMQARVKGYVEVSKITGGPDTRGLPQPANAGDNQIPF